MRLKTVSLAVVIISLVASLKVMDFAAPISAAPSAKRKTIPR